MTRTSTKAVRWLRTPDRVLLLLCLMYLVIYIDRVNISTAAGAIRSDLHLSATQLGLAFSAFAYPYALVQLLGGWLGDRLGPRVTLVACGLVFAAATILTGLANSLAALVAFRILLGLGEAPAFATATRAMSTWLPAARRGFAQGATHAAARLGNAVAPPLVALLIGFTTWRGAFFVLGAVTLIWVLAWAMYFRDDPAEHPGMAPSDLAKLRGPDAPPLAGEVPVARLLRRLLPVTLVDFCYGWTLWVYMTWLPSFFLDAYGFDLKTSALFAGGILFGGVVGDTLGGLLSDRILQRTGDLRRARRDLIAGALVASLVCLVPVLFVKNVIVVSLCLSGAFFFMELAIGPLWSVPMDIAPRYAGTASGFMNFGYGLAGIVSPVVFGIVIDWTGDWHLPFAISIGLLLLGAVATFWMHPDRPFEDGSGGERLIENPSRPTLQGRVGAPTSQHGRQSDRRAGEGHIRSGA